MEPQPRKEVKSVPGYLVWVRQFRQQGTDAKVGPFSPATGQRDWQTPQRRITSASLQPRWLELHAAAQAGDARSGSCLTSSTRFAISNDRPDPVHTAPPPSSSRPNSAIQCHRRVHKGAYQIPFSLLIGPASPTALVNDEVPPCPTKPSAITPDPGLRRQQWTPSFRDTAGRPTSRMSRLRMRHRT